MGVGAHRQIAWQRCKQNPAYSHGPAPIAIHSMASGSYCFVDIAKRHETKVCGYSKDIFPVKSWRPGSVDIKSRPSGAD